MMTKILKHFSSTVALFLAAHLSMAQIEIRFDVTFERNSGINKATDGPQEAECHVNVKKQTTTCYYPGGGKYSVAEWVGDVPNGEITFWHPNRKVMQVLHYLDGKLDGTVEVYRTNGKILFRSNWKAGLQQGQMIEYYESGKVFQTTNWVDGKLDGLLVEYHENGKKSVEMFYKNDVPQGQLVNYYDNGKKRVTASVLDGYINGWATEYYPSGAEKAKEYYSGANLRQDSSFYYYESGQLESVFHWRNDTLNGSVKKWTPSGALEFIAEYDQGKKVNQKVYGASGITQFQLYDDHGELKRAVAFNEEGDTSSAFYYENGEVSLTSSYRYNDDGLRSVKTVNKSKELHGPQSTYYPNGQEESRIYFKNGIQDGLELKWNENGGKWLVWNFKNGSMDGKQESFHPTGVRGSLSYWNNGTRVDTSWRWSKTGQLTSLAINTKDSIYEKIYENEELIMIQIYLPQGPQGKLTRTKVLHYLNGEFVEEEKQFYRDGKVYKKEYRKDGVHYKTEVRDKEKSWKWNTIMH